MSRLWMPCLWIVGFTVTFPVFLRGESDGESAESGGSGTARVEREFIEPFLASQESRLASAETLPTLAPHLRAFLGRLENWLGVHVEDIRKRRQIREAARSELTSRLAERLANAGVDDSVTRAGTMVGVAVEGDHARRRDHLLGNLLCWCPRAACNFTRTVAGCPDPCAKEQKDFVDSWLEESLSDAEIFDRMVAHDKGGLRVLAAPHVVGAQRIGFYLPLALAAIAAVGVALLLVRATARGRAQARSGGGVESGDVLGSGAVAADAARFDEEIEHDLKEMDDAW